jgi:hypothetical protein
VTVTSTWQGRSLVSEGALKAPNGDTTTLREVVSLGADGKTLTMEVTTEQQNLRPSFVRKRAI